ncbi:PAS domain-containing sensor histidine kinase [Pedobacter foliorum]|uniref:PAS domain-containing sensor histidine kinase n=1 Tax=Pedobacter foliorum TaxID=2739058 RepID=UPI00156378FB|nr:PAS domain-containing sensor histidine kinase [Pedobacter foliorum]NRF37481.1 PAS domain-containing sensor histidine kinase [Pedobacter foliorum]
MIPTVNIQNGVAQERFDSEPFFEVSQDLMCMAGFDGYFKRINPAVSKLLGYTQEELFSRPINDFVYEDDKGITDEHRNNLRENVPLLNFENRYQTKNGEIVWLSWTSIPVPESKLVYAVAKNVTHTKKLEEERNKLLVSLSRINEELHHLTHMASHDLRAPVSNLLAIFSLLDMETIQDEETRNLINILQSTTEGLNVTLNYYLEAACQKKSLHVPTENLNLHQSLDGVLHSINSLVLGSRAVLHIDFSEFDTLNFNKVYMESIFLNLITNSIKYAKPGSHPDISIVTKRTNGSQQLIFSDKGLGFDMEKVKHKVFGLHQTFHNHPDSKGIGLFLIYNHINSLGGQIQVESKINEGVRFVLTFKD